MKINVELLDCHLGCNQRQHKMLGEIVIKVCELYKSSKEILRTVIKISEILLASENVESYGSRRAGPEKCRQEFLPGSEEGRARGQILRASTSTLLPEALLPSS